MSFWGELKRRNVFKVGAAYVIVAWLIVQVANTFFPILHLPEWIVTLVAFLLILGLPIALIHAWAYEVTPDGIKRTKEVPLADSITHLTGKKLNYVLAGLLIVAVGYIIVLQFFINKPPVQTEVASTVTEQTPDAVKTIEVKKSPKTIAVLPFDDLSPEKDQEYFVLGLSEEILNSLCQIPNLGVTGRTSSFAFKGTGKTIQEIAEILNVDNILEGSVRKAGNELRITAQLVQALDDLHLWSKTYDRKLEDIFEVQEDIATAIADELKVTLGIVKSNQQLGSTDNLEAYELYLAAKGQFYSYEYLQALESVNAAIALDPEFALAWAIKASIHWSQSTRGPSKNAKAEKDLLLQAALKAIEIEPGLGQAYLSLGIAKLVRGDFIGAELSFQKGMQLAAGPITPSEYGLDNLYNTVGYIEKFYELMRSARKNDPLNKNNRSGYMLSLGFLGDMQQAEEEYERGKGLFGDQWLIGDLFIMYLKLGAKDALSINDIPEAPDDPLDPLLSTVRKYLNSPENALIEMKRIYKNDNELSAGLLVNIASFAAYFDDPEFALGAIDKSVSIEASGLFHIWLPVMHDVRQLPRFKEFVREIGLVDYWEKFGWPDLCHPTDDGDFVCD